MHDIIVVRKTSRADGTSSLVGPSIEETSSFGTLVAKHVSESVSRWWIVLEPCVRACCDNGVLTQGCSAVASVLIVAAQSLLHLVVQARMMLQDAGRV